jgi:EAL domain-containing protein (putative c-di-GMP-specific phosphodiesterase class I)
MVNETSTRPDTESLILSGEPTLEYQPLIDLVSGRLLGFEALLRWRHPDEGLILPSLLLPWLEANGDIVQLGEWVLTEGCQQAASWPKNIQLAVNLSLVQLRRGVGSSAVAGALERSGIEPDRLTIEVTEHAMVEDVAMNDLRAIGALGVELAVDDVGTSWTSFDVLRRMEVNTVKIDRSFVGSLEAQQGINRLIVETVVSLAHSEGISTVAEGVETSQQAGIVREFECDAAQGYYFAPPLSIEVATDLANEPGYCFAFEGAGWSEHKFDVQPTSVTPPVPHHPFTHTTRKGPKNTKTK